MRCEIERGTKGEVRKKRGTTKTRGNKETGKGKGTGTRRKETRTGKSDPAYGPQRSFPFSFFSFFFFHYFVLPLSSHVCPAPALFLYDFSVLSLAYAGCSAIGCRQDGTACSAHRSESRHKKYSQRNKAQTRRYRAVLCTCFSFSFSFLAHSHPHPPPAGWILVCCDPV